ncbi:hypothetical protein [Endozoicomonas sp. SCSIO W0465]|uniref:hypothetical protein n=1 Tax=Endozoicomonas sp. SCSIO W0465 TaxID=2918516 RepID=UPI0020757A67|nr:hypothetical protein [Endozoicomonas sp. SCSIO W0465]USE34053.1 hypothetical protein MJO57_17985 [Endozoicomonas sp. SCSIO W0465]
MANFHCRAVCNPKRALNNVFNPLKLRPIYRNKLTILCDQPDQNKQPRFEAFKRDNGFLELNSQLHVLNVNGLEDYYPEHLATVCTRRDKVKKAKWMAHNITQSDFENQMPIIFNALNHCWMNAYSSDPVEQLHITDTLHIKIPTEAEL